MNLWFRNYKFKIILILFALWGGIFYFWGEVKAEGLLEAQPGDVVINELMWMGSSKSTYDEWIELRNMTDKDIDFEVMNWFIYKNNLLILVLDKGILKANGYFLISNYTQDDDKSILNIIPDFVNTDISLSNKDAQYKLYNSPDDEDVLIDIADDGGGSPFAGEYNKPDDIYCSMERNYIPSDGMLEESWHTATIPRGFDEGSFEIGTPGFQNNEAPIVNIDSPQDGDEFTQDEEIDFIATVSDPEDEKITDDSLIWNSDIDGEIGRGESLSLSNLSLGQHLITFVIKDSDGVESSESVEIEIIKLNQPPEAEIIADKTNVSVGETIGFDASNSSDPDENSLTFTWDFRDGEGSEEMSPAHTYSSPGTYTVSLIVGDGEFSDTDTLMITVNKPVYSDDIRINEFLPNPKGSDTENEWIELYNNSSSEVDLSNWIIDDEEGGSSPYVLPQGTTIKAEEYLIVYRSQTKIALNNNSDEVRLFHPDGNLVDQVSFSESAKENFSYNWTSTNAWAWSEKLTPGEKNEEQIEIIDIKTARSKEKGSVVKVEGIITVVHGILSDKYFYVQDKSGGIQIYSYEGDFPELKLGNEIEVQGEISFSEAKIKISSEEDINILSSDNAISSKLVKTGKIDESLEGMLVTVSSQVTKTSGSTFYLDDGSGEVKIYIIKSTEIKKPEMSKGDWFTITGIVSETSSGYRILPRYQNDVREGTVEGVSMLPATGASLDNILWISIVLVFLIVWYNKTSSKLKVQSLR